MVFDEYGRADQLLDAFGFDVTPFQDALRSQGFKIVARSHANLPTTCNSRGLFFPPQLAGHYPARSPLGTTLI